MWITEPGDIVPDSFALKGAIPSGIAAASWTITTNLQKLNPRVMGPLFRRLGIAAHGPYCGFTQENPP
jgi:hypothetical protein